ncbi:hypothetical protein SeMB42_g00559 [Synchytrium endobioticum]|uniref:Uncharacterized protein n=1 Tax=Synchytrium endobioticum TaxID=286115 RepID=A0A507DRP2_9FUNG|nr:hypothetical protein SeMB42_g00559 [Synchytrium endobioticum]
MSKTQPKPVTPDELWKSRIEKINGELFSLTYGSVVAQLIKDYEDFINRGSHHLNAFIHCCTCFSSCYLCGKYMLRE